MYVRNQPWVFCGNQCTVNVHSSPSFLLLWNFTLSEQGNCGRVWPIRLHYGRATQRRAMRSSPRPDPKLSFSLTEEAVEDGQRKGRGGIPLPSPAWIPAPLTCYSLAPPFPSYFHHLLDFRFHRSAHFCKNRFKQLGTICQFITSQSRNIKKGEANINPLSTRMSLF